MPPPPAGMRLLKPHERKKLIRHAAAQTPAADDADGEADNDMEELRALEDVALDPKTRPEAELLQSVQRLGFGNPLREALLGALDDSALDETAAPELPVVTDLKSFDISKVRDEYDIPVEMQPLVVQYIRFFQGAGRKWFRHWMSRSSRYIPMMQPILEASGVPRDLVYLAMIESGFSPKAMSWARAAGPWQFIAPTGKLMGLRQDFWVDERRDPLKSTTAAAKYLTILHNDLGHWYLAWAGYNAGGHRLHTLVERRGTTDFWELSDGRGLAKETKHYVPKLIACALVAKHPKAFGFSDDEFDFEKPLEFDEVQVPEATDLEVVARAANATLDQLHELNPELKRWCTPPATQKRPYTLRVPKGSGAPFAEAFAKVAPAERMTFRSHTVHRGDTLSQLAQVYGSAPEAIMRVNGLKSVRALRMNSTLMIPIPSHGALREGRRDAAFDRQVARARRGGYVSRLEDEVPAGAPKQSTVALGPIKTEQINGRTRITYGVQSGDNLWAISQRFHCTVEDLRSWNNLPVRNRGLKIGTVLTLWPPDKTSSL